MAAKELHFDVDARAKLKKGVDTLAEAVKVALIRDAAFFAWLEGATTELRSGDEPALAQAVERAARLHLEHIARGGDPFEMGSARPLDYGHWAAHKLEVLSEHELRHGEAVAYGMKAASAIAVARGTWRAEDDEALTKVLDGMGPLPAIGALDVESILAATRRDKKVVAGALHFVLPTRIGETTIVTDVDESQVRLGLAAIGLAS